MSQWVAVNGREAKDKVFCPQCGATLMFGSALRVPELLKCSGCKAQWCFISRGDKPVKAEAQTK